MIKLKRCRTALMLSMLHEAFSVNNNIFFHTHKVEMYLTVILSNPLFIMGYTTVQHNWQKVIQSLSESLQWGRTHHFVGQSVPEVRFHIVQKSNWSIKISGSPFTHTTVKLVHLIPYLCLSFISQTQSFAFLSVKLYKVVLDLQQFI